MGHDVKRQPCSDPAQSKTLRMSGSDLHGSWEISSAPEAKLGTGGAGKAKSRNPAVHAGEKSDTSVVPRKPPNKGDTPAEVVEERDVAKGNTNEPPTPRTQSQDKSVSLGLDGVREAARRSKTVRFTALLHRKRAGIPP
jgi:RNA-directed DNA polymerase